MQDYSILNDYQHGSKSCNALDVASYPLRRALGGHTVDLITGKEGESPSTAMKVAMLILSFIIFPIALVGTICLIIKACAKQEKNQVTDLLKKILPPPPLPLPLPSPPAPSPLNALSNSKIDNSSSVDNSPPEMKEPNPSNEHERRIILAKKEFLEAENRNPAFEVNRYRVWYTGPQSNRKQRWADHWQEALSSGDVAKVKPYLDNPFFRGHNHGNVNPFEILIRGNHFECFKLLVLDKRTCLDDRTVIWSKEDQSSDVILLALIKMGKKREDYIFFLLDQGYDVCLLKNDYISFPGYNTLSPECRKKIEDARKNEQGKLLNTAIENGNPDEVRGLLQKGVCVNRSRGEALDLAVTYYMNDVPGNLLLRSKPSTSTVEQREQIIHLLLDHPLMRIPFRGNKLLVNLCRPNRPAGWEALVAKIIRFGVDPTSGDVAELIFQMRFEQLSQNSPIKQALTTSQELIFKQCIQERFINTVFGVHDSGNMPGDVYRMLQGVWEQFKDFKVLKETFSEKTIKTLSQSIKTIPIFFEDDQIDGFLKQLQQGVPVIIPTGWTGHATSIVICGNKIILGNVGERSEKFTPGLHVYEFDITKLTPEIFKDLPSTGQDRFFTQYYFETRLMERLDGRKISYLPLPDQIVGNCTWASSALLGFFSALFLTSEKEEGKRLEDVKKFVYEEFEPKAKLIAIEQYIKDYKYALQNAWIGYSERLLHRLLENYLKEARKLPENAPLYQRNHIYEVIDALVYSGLVFRLNAGNDEMQENINLLEKRYSLKWNERLKYLLNNQEAIYSDLPPSWHYYDSPPLGH